MSDETCKTCRYWNRSAMNEGFGSCDLTLEWFANEQAPKNKIHTWDYEGYKSGAWCGEDFGCIHHEDEP